MYSINLHSDDYIELQSADAKSYAKIQLREGASLQSLRLANKEIIKDLSPLSYAETYASALLFPFVNRVKDGKYSFEGQNYQLDINEPENNNAHHGLVYNQHFELLEAINNAENATVGLVHKADGSAQGFPFSYQFEVYYTLMAQQLEIKVYITNLSQKAFPYTIGWHPYFYSSDLSQTKIYLNSHQKALFDSRGLTQGFEEVHISEAIHIGDKHFDDCFQLKTPSINFQTPDYKISIEQDIDEPFFQVYTPPIRSFVALEPTTGLADSFNNKIGLRVLKPEEKAAFSWKLILQ